MVLRKFATLSLVVAAVLTAGGIASAASTTYDASLVSPDGGTTSGWYQGSGNPNGGFTVVTDNGIVLAMRAKYRQNPAVIDSATNEYDVVTGAQTVATSGGGSAAPTRAAWNYEWGIDLSGTNLTLGTIKAALTVSDTQGHSTKINPVTYWADNASFGSSGKHVGLISANPTDTSAQQSENLAFGDSPLGPVFFPLAPFDMNANETYTFKLDIVSGPTTVLASDTIVVKVGEGGGTVVPLPASVWSGFSILLLVGAGFLVKRVRRHQPVALKA